MSWKLSRKVEDVLHLDPETMIKQHREIFMFLLGEHAKRVTKLEVVAGAARKLTELIEREELPKKARPALASMSLALADFKDIDDKLRPKKKKGVKK